jgi:hypothetical protein
MISYIAVQNSSRPDLDRDKDVQDLKRRSHRGEEIASDNGAGMIVNERRPQSRILAGNSPMSI